ncbi:MAG: hypothetical protein AB8B99_21265 [Phormidesmis sp.]
MSQQAPKLVSDTHYCVVGDVSVDSTAAIAPGVVLQAASGSRIVIGKGVCLAAGVCIQSRKGVLTIAEGVSLGANVLVVGHGEVGLDACISAGSTLINPSVSSETVVPPDSLVGELQTPSPQGSHSQHSSQFQSGDRSGAQPQYVAQPASGYQSTGFSDNSFQSNGYQSTGFQGFQGNGFQGNGFQSSDSQGSRFQSADSLGNGFQNNRYQGGSSQIYSTFQSQHSSPDDGVQSTYAQSQNSRAGGYQGGNEQFGNSQRENNRHENSYNGKNDGGNGSAHASDGIDSSSQMTVNPSYDRVYGREQVSRLISALFPNRHTPDS